MKLPVLAVVFWTVSNVPGALGSNVEEREEKHAVRGSYSYDVSVLTPIQELLKEQFVTAADTPTFAPTLAPSASPGPSDIPSLSPSSVPSEGFSNIVASENLDASFPPLLAPSDLPSDLPSNLPSDLPSNEVESSFMEIEAADASPTLAPSASPGPSDLPSLVPSSVPSDLPSLLPSERVRDNFISAADVFPTLSPSASPAPSGGPSDVPSLIPSNVPSLGERGQVIEELLPGDDPLVFIVPSLSPSASPQPSDVPSLTPSSSPGPSLFPSEGPSASPGPSLLPSEIPSDEPLKVIEKLLPDDDPISGGGGGAITCDLDASIACETTDGEACSFSPVSSEDLMCKDSPTQLSWLYKGGNCTSSTSDSSFICQDLADGGPTSASAVFIEIHGEESEEVYYQGFASRTQTGSLDSIIELNRAFSTPMENIFIHIKRDDPSGELLQMLVIPNVCDSQNGLIVGNTYGALQFGGYQTTIKSVQGFKHLEWTFTARSEAGLDLTVKMATVVLGKDMKTFNAGATLSPGEEATFVTDETIVLGESGLFSGAVTVVAEGSDGMECAAAAASYIYV